MNSFDTSALPTCENCPLATIITGQIETLMSTEFEKSEMQHVSAVVGGMMINLMQICEKSIEIDCPGTPKQLPEVPDPMPPIGHPDRIAYGRHCLAYLAVRKMQGKD